MVIYNRQLRKIESPEYRGTSKCTTVYNMPKKYCGIPVFLHTPRVSEYGKLTDTEINWSIISSSVTIIIFVEFIDQLIDYPINCASLSSYVTFSKVASSETWLGKQAFPFRSVIYSNWEFWHIWQLIGHKSPFHCSFHWLPACLSAFSGYWEHSGHNAEKVIDFVNNLILFQFYEKLELTLTMPGCSDIIYPYLSLWHWQSSLFSGIKEKSTERYLPWRQLQLENHDSFHVGQ